MFNVNNKDTRVLNNKNMHSFAKLNVCTGSLDSKVRRQITCLVCRLRVLFIYRACQGFVSFVEMLGYIGGGNSAF